MPTIKENTLMTEDEKKYKEDYIQQEFDLREKGLN